MKSQEKEKIKVVIRDCLRAKFKKYKPESKHMPFHFSLLGKDRMALYSFIQSLNTTFGSSIFEPVAKEIAFCKFQKVGSQCVLGNKISDKAQNEIQLILNDLSIGKDAFKPKDIDRIRKVCNKGVFRPINTVKVDLFLKSKDDEVYLFDLKTVKPNKSNFKDFKKTLLEWIAIYLLEYPNAEINSLIAIPYNPYFPEPYQRWTMKGMLDLKNELKVAEEFWNFLGDSQTYKNLLMCFESVGLEMRDEIDEYFLKFK